MDGDGAAFGRAGSFDRRWTGAQIRFSGASPTARRLRGGGDIDTSAGAVAASGLGGEDGLLLQHPSAEVRP